jgi:hypothetical protein
MCSEEPDVVTEWPPCTCVTAFVVLALDHFGHHGVDAPSIAKRLHTLVGPKDRNPWGLEVTSSENERGVSQVDAERHLPSILADHDSRLDFRHIPVNTVANSMYSSLLEEAHKKGCFVGVGVDRARLVGGPNTLRHVLIVEPADDDRLVNILDPTESTCREPRTIKWDSLEEVIHAVRDGFWVIGHVAALSLTDALPWATRTNRPGV